jgi:hypothetical protein
MSRRPIGGRESLANFPLRSHSGDGRFFVRDREGGCSGLAAPARDDRAAAQCFESFCKSSRIAMVMDSIEFNQGPL